MRDFLLGGLFGFTVASCIMVIDVDADVEVDPCDAVSIPDAASCDAGCAGPGAVCICGSCVEAI